MPTFEDSIAEILGNAAKARNRAHTGKDPEMTAPPMLAKEDFKFGCDPELFVFDDTGKPVSAAGLIPGTKSNPHPVKYGAVQVDGMAAEFNIEPVTTFQEWNRNISAVMSQLEAFLPKGFTLKAVPSVVFAPEVFDAAPDDAKELGCMPDFNAWTGELNPPPHSPDNPFLRTASGHIHIGWGDDIDLSDMQHVMNCRDLVKQLDWYLGAWSVKIDSDPIRRLLYGKAGACRFKSYGVEYRVLSNFWITSRERRLVVWNRLQMAIHDMQRRYVPDRTSEHDSYQVIRSINNSERDSYLENIYRFPISSIDPSFCRF